jgi:hypothetical protein
VEDLQYRSVGHVAQYCVQHRPAPDKKQSRSKRERAGEKEKPFYAYFKGKKGGEKQPQSLVSAPDFDMKAVSTDCWPRFYLKNWQLQPCNLK